MLIERRGPCLLCRETHAAGWQAWDAKARAVEALSGDERAFWTELRAGEVRRCEWLAGRWVAKHVVRRWALESCRIELHLQDAAIHMAEGGRPVVVWTTPVRAACPEISIAHTRTAVVAALVDADAATFVGIDVEPIVPLEAALLDTVFTSAERRLLRGHRGAGASRCMLRYWCAKEAAAKATGWGLRARPQDYVVSQLDNADSALQVKVSVEQSSSGRSANAPLCIPVSTWVQDDLVFALATVAKAQFDAPSPCR